MPKPVDDETPIIISISSEAVAQIAAMEASAPEYRRDIAVQINADIKKHIAPWTPRSERGGEGRIKWCEQLSLHLNANVYRLKPKYPDLDRWRVFFFLLDLDTPPTRHVQEVVEWQSNEQCYDDMSQPHVHRLRAAISRFKNLGRMSLMRR